MASQNEVDDMIKRVQTSKGVQGIPIRTSMDNDTTLHYAALISQLIVHAKRVVREIDSSQELEQLRLRSYKHEIIVAPESKYIMIVIQVPEAV
ncbi:unnamed protein product [Adineta steineri]|uniref:Roadblock/LAMTOR2 domain-containing protein n=1 Tax=Adineta steineri TaxID=433720 RepID=A0A814CR66_9BILA|nr:unnamed protein product [Adineta steineri]CAF0854139.1 unnamed protein product [Adineta steineri]CAF0856238.1 unnamed protein product [Adineta steineri]CAF0948029.1 unnamed protein product [Adineta steineri]CAF3638800.1 unnamed protein product [Adineta steineri]